MTTRRNKYKEFIQRQKRRFGEKPQKLSLKDILKTFFHHDHQHLRWLRANISKKTFKRLYRSKNWHIKEAVVIESGPLGTSIQPIELNQPIFQPALAPAPTWSYRKAVADKAAIRAAHRAAFEAAGVDRPPAPTWSYIKSMVTSRSYQIAHRVAFQRATVDHSPAPTWSYRRSVSQQPRASSSLFSTADAATIEKPKKFKKLSESSPSCFSKGHSRSFSSSNMEL